MKLTKSTRIIIPQKKLSIPILGSLDLDDFYESYLIAEQDRECYVLPAIDFVFKVYTFKLFIEDEKTQL